MLPDPGRKDGFNKVPIHVKYIACYIRVELETAMVKFKIESLCHMLGVQVCRV